MQDVAELISELQQYRVEYANKLQDNVALLQEIIELYPDVKKRVEEYFKQKQIKPNIKLSQVKIHEPRTK